MFARVTTVQGPPNSVEEGRRAIEQQVLPAARQMKGFRGLLSLVDRTTGKAVSITLWESEEAMRQSEDAASRLRTNSAATIGSQIVSVDRFEVVVDATAAGAV